MTRPEWLAVTLAAVIGVAGCAVKVIHIDGGGGGGNDAGEAGDADLRYPAPFCIDHQNEREESCRSCYDRAGNETNSRCVLPPACTVQDGADGLPCLLCVGADGNATVTACLSCEPARDICRVCTWSDTAALCRVCVDASGAPSSAACLALRSERL